MIKEVYGILTREFGELEWWPAGSAFERVVGAILVQQTRWESVEKVLAVLDKKGLLTPKTMGFVSLEELEELVRPAGFHRQKARYLKGVASYFSDRPEKELFSLPADLLHRELLSLDGIGKETADAIMLYAADRQRFVLDAYAKRMFGCLGLKGGYGQIQEKFADALGTDLHAHRQCHALIVEHGKRYCSRKRCGECAVARYRAGEKL
ncbi:MAG TPA: DNA-3-methyladenine glycosylase [Methanocellaceae archaeon]